MLCGRHSLYRCNDLRHGGSHRPRRQDLSANRGRHGLDAKQVPVVRAAGGLTDEQAAE
jgi:hypothetical protein